MMRANEVDAGNLQITAVDIALAESDGAVDRYLLKGASSHRVVRLPGTAKNKGDAMFSPANYGFIYRNTNAPLMADFLRIEYYSDQFIKEIRRNETMDPKLKKVVSLSQTHILACTSFLCELCRGVIQPNEIAPMLGSSEDLKDFFGKQKTLTLLL